jgi:hypothetical protein
VRAALAIGALVAAVSAGNVGAAQVPSSGGGLEVSPDGRFVLLTRQRGNRYLRSWEVWVAEASGGRAKRLRPASNRPMAATWTRDGLASVTTEGTRYVLRPTDGALVTQMPAPSGQEVQSPDGGRVARVRGDTLYLGSVDGWLAPHAWFPDGIRIATCLPAGVGIVSMRGGRPHVLPIRC